MPRPAHSLPPPLLAPKNHDSAAVHSRPAAAGRTRRAAATPAALPPARGHAAAAAEALSTSLELLYGAPAFEDDDASLSTTDTPLDGLSNAEAGLAAWEAVQACVAKHVADAGPAGLPVVALSGDAGGAVVAAALASVADESSAAAFVSGLAECETESSADRERARYTADLLGLELFEVESPLACDLVADPACRARAALNAVVAAASAAAGRSGSVVFCRGRWRAPLRRASLPFFLPD